MGKNKKINYQVSYDLSTSHNEQLKNIIYLQVIELLLGHGTYSSGRLEVNAINHSGLTALDLLLIFPSEAGDREVEEILRSAGAKRMRDVTPSESPSPESYGQTAVNSPASAETTRQQT